MSNSNDTRPEDGNPDTHPTATDQDGGHSGEGAASALAQLKTQTKQHRRQAGDGADPSGGSSQ
jgi:hypothetical protein